MSGRGLGASAEVDQRRMAGRGRIGLAARPTVLVTLLTVFVVLLGAGHDAAYATSSFYWYGENNSTCWQAGQPGSSSFACDSVGAGYLPTPGGGAGGLAHMLEGGISADVFGVSSSGDYCNYYRLGDHLTLQDSTNEGPTTGYTTPTPYSSYQESDAYKNVCQANGAYWGQEVRRSAPENGCWTTCGMHHYVSFHSQGTSDRPWNSLFGGPTLVVSAEANPQVLSYSSEDVGAWGYICPVLQDVTTSGILEYCLQEWRAKTNSSEWSQERVGTCAGAGGDSLDTIQTFFWPGTQFVTERAGSSNTSVLNYTGWRYFTAGISTANLQNAINADNKQCGRGLSSNPANYALLGVEQGLEGWRNISEIGGSSANLQLRTEYTPLLPIATTSAATGVLEEQAVLNGNVNPSGLDTKYHFEYGTSNAYGSSTSTADAGSGSGSSSVPENATITGLLQNTTYHYRIVANNAAGSSYGSDGTFKTSFIHTTPTAIREAGTGYQWIYYIGSEHAVYEWTWNGSSWFNSRPGGFVLPNSNPTAVRDNTSGNQWVYYGGGGDDAIWQGYWNGSTETQTHIGGEIALNSSPVALRESPTGYQWVYYVGRSDNAIWEWTWNGSSWFNSRPGGFVYPGTSPAAIRDTKSGNQWVYYVGGGDDAIWQGYWNGSTETQTHLGGEVAPNTSPVVLREEKTGYQWVYYVNKSDKSIWEWTWNGSSWSQSRPGGFVAPNTTPAVVREEGTGYQWVYYVGGGDGAIWEWTWNGSQWVESRPGGLTASGTSPAVVQPWAGFQWVYYQDSEDPMTQLFWNGGTWSNLSL